MQSVCCSNSSVFNTTGAISTSRPVEVLCEANEDIFIEQDTLSVETIEYWMGVYDIFTLHRGSVMDIPHPIEVDKNNRVIDGRCRLVAAKRIGLKKLPVKVKLNRKDDFNPGRPSK
jgi:hypothetical protein